MGETTPETTAQLVSHILDCAAELENRFGTLTLAGVMVREITWAAQVLMDQVDRPERREAAWCPRISGEVPA